MVIDDLNLVGIAISPSEANPVLVVDPQTPLAFPIAFEPLQPVTRRLVQVFNAKNPVNLPELAQSNSFYRPESPAVTVIEDFLSFSVGERANHA